MNRSSADSNCSVNSEKSGNIVNILRKGFRFFIGALLVIGFLRGGMVSAFELAVDFNGNKELSEMSSSGIREMAACTIELARAEEAEGCWNGRTVEALETAIEAMNYLRVNDAEGFGREGDFVLNDLRGLVARISQEIDERDGGRVRTWKTEAAGRKTGDWTVLVYAVTDSFLLDTVMADIDEMEGSGCGSSVEVMVQLDSGNHDAVRYRVAADGMDGKVTSPIVEHLGQLDCGNWKSLYDFVAWGISAAPSRRVALVLHGCLGNLGYGAPESLSTDTDTDTEAETLMADRLRGRENGARYMGISHMGKALTAISELLGRRIDLVLVDDSSGSNLEKLYEYRSCVSHWVASAGFVPTDNFPYHTILGYLVSNPDCSLDEISIKAVEFFAESYKSYCNLPFGFGATLTAWDLGKVDDMCERMKTLGALLEKRCKKGEWRSAVLVAAEKSLGCMGSEHPDLIEWFGNLSGAVSQDAEVAECVTGIEKSFSETRLAHHGAGRFYRRACGISMTITKWFGGYGHYDTAKYRNLKWSKYSNWIKFLIRLSK
ncbi:MAG: hypothetical protein CVV64_11785 [Candidatus Wallbacteria bacterium HGW-Wallbacteria-1]|jgi:hypothetical protein|uniref:Uncharacterized protein n=1 Tax=Candidatus Wallbacteria bacterium HGW-Wallbacteria-1 TaxID=2013854 RepID=A0A2N1PNV0_9BACT|nr:MAG: hypothetical protein CVV64_11785 [Candidatus Wallbacteria bacterium HGW-Wallbacteria-1]